jgi:hypothetical protein
LLLAQIKDPAGTACLLLIELLAKRAPSLLRSGPGPDLPFLLVERGYFYCTIVLFTLYYLGQMYVEIFDCDDVSIIPRPLIIHYFLPLRLRNPRRRRPGGDLMSSQPHTRARSDQRLLEYLDKLYVAAILVFTAAVHKPGTVRSIPKSLRPGPR